MNNFSEVSFPFTHRNRAGRESFARNPKEHLVRLLTVGQFGQTYYASTEANRRELDQVLQWFVTSDPRFLAQATVYARNAGLRKDLPLYALAVLSAARSKKYFLESFNQVVRTPDDLIQFYKIVCAGEAPGVKAFGGVRLVASRVWLEGFFSEYHAVKYSSKQSRDGEVTLRKIVQLCHPKAKDPCIHERLGWVTRGWKWIGPDPSPTNPKIWALEALKRTTSEDKAVRLITEYGLPFEAVVPAVKQATTKVWEALLRNAPYMNLLRSLNTFERHGVFNNPENVDYAVSALTQPERVKRSRLYPFRFLAAFEVLRVSGPHEQILRDAVAQGLDLSFLATPDFPEGMKVGVFPDVSGSMACGRVSLGKSQDKQGGRTYTYVEIAGIYAAAVFKKTQGNALVLPVDTELHHPTFASTDNMMNIARKIARYGGGGTSLGLPLQHLLDHKIKLDCYVGITDNEDWAYGNGFRSSMSFYEAWCRYRAEVNPNAKAFLVTIDASRSAVAPAWDESVHFIYGWDESVIGYIPHMMRGGSGQIAEIEAIPMPD